MNKPYTKYLFIVLATFIFIYGMCSIKKAYGIDKFDDDCFYIDVDEALKDLELHQLQAIVFDDCKTYKDKYIFHKENAERCFKEAKDKCWWLPDISDRDKARYCLTSIGAVLSSSDPKSKIVTVVVTALIQYGLDCCDQWNEIQNKLKWAQYHFEMMEFFEQLINQDDTPKTNKNKNAVRQVQVPVRHATIPISNIKKKAS